MTSLLTCFLRKLENYYLAGVKLLKSKGDRLVRVTGFEPATTRPQTCALPGCATPRLEFPNYIVFDQCQEEGECFQNRFSRTQGALSIGSVARVMMNFGFNELFLVNPRCDLHSEDAFKMATHAKEICKRQRLLKALKLLSKVAQESLRQPPNSGIEIGSWKICNCLLYGLFKLTPQMQSFLVLKTES